MAPDPAEPTDLRAHVVEFTGDPTVFLTVADTFLAADPVLTTAIATATIRYRNESAAGRTLPANGTQWWAVVRTINGDIEGLAMRTAQTPPHPIFVLSMPDPAARALAHSVHARGELIGGVNGALPAAEICATDLAHLQGAQVQLAHHTRLLELGELVPPHGVPGTLRAATLDDLDLAQEWTDCFMRDADEQAGRIPQVHEGEPDRADIRRRIEQGTCWFWLDNAGARVHLTGANPPAFGVARIAPVYTPPQQRRKGYASAAVAAVSQLLLTAGSRVCLYTDQANPTSNNVYQAIGYRPVVDHINLRIVNSAGRL